MTVTGYVYLRRFLLLLITSLFSISIQPTQGDAFVVYDAMKSRFKPDLTQYGLQPIQVIYAGWLWEKGEARTEPNLDRIRQVSNALDPQIPVCIDIEHWKVKGDLDLVEDSLRKLKYVADSFKLLNPDAMIGYYGILPIRDYWRAIGAKGNRAKQQWVQENLRIKALAASVDIVFPSLYTFYNKPDKWVRYAKENIKEARKYKKPVYVFLWPRFHRNQQDIPVEFWRLQLKTAKENADGIVLWDISTSIWDPEAKWWNETVSFLNETSEGASDKGVPFGKTVQ